MNKNNYVIGNDSEMEYEELVMSKGQSYKIEVPSGLLMFADLLENDYKEIFSHIESECFNIFANNKEDLAKMTSNYSKFNIGQLFVGNSNPNVYQSENNILIGDINIESTLNFKNMGRVITDVWSVMIVDMDIYRELVNKYIKSTPELNADFDSIDERYNYYLINALEDSDVCLNVEPGTYELIVNDDCSTANFKARMVKSD